MSIAGNVRAAVLLACAIAAPAEGLRQTAYRDVGGILTVCLGDTHDVDPVKVYSIDECMARLDARMTEAVQAVDRCVPDLPRPALAAFGDAVYNLGPAIVCDKVKSTVARLLAAGKIADACRQLPLWNRARVAGVLIVFPGLTVRRERERDVCLTGLAA